MSSMQINFSTSRLEALYFGDKKEEIRAKLSLPILKKYRKALLDLYNAASFPEIWKIRSYNLEKVEGHRSMKLNDQRRLEIDFSEDGEIKVVDILRISNHYGEKIR